jgi:hypothetical protein
VTKLIGFAGRKFSGKDTAADFLIEILQEPHSQTAHTYAKIRKTAFAEPLKQIACIFGFTPKSLYDAHLKEIPDTFWDVTPRKFLQLVGTDLFRKGFREDVWLKMAAKTLNQSTADLTIFTDVRFKNEAEWILANGGFVIGISRINTGVEDTHDTEQNLPVETMNYIISNDGTLEDLNIKMRLCAESLRLIQPKHEEIDNGEEV